MRRDLWRLTMVPQCCGVFPLSDRNLKYWPGLVSPLSCRVLQTPQLISKSSRDIRISFLQSENITRTLLTQECMDRLVDSLCWHSIHCLNWIWYSFREEIGSRNKIFKYFTLFIKSVNVNKVLASHVWKVETVAKGNIIYFSSSSLPPSPSELCIHSSQNRPPWENS